ncbi:MAG: hypothetical protein AB1505_36845, partial [Candidatus Latescibacterota bacterium]
VTASATAGVASPSTRRGAYLPGAAFALLFLALALPRLWAVEWPAAARLAVVLAGGLALYRYTAGHVQSVALATVLLAAASQLAPASATPFALVICLGLLASAAWGVRLSAGPAARPLPILGLTLAAAAAAVLALSLLAVSLLGQGQLWPGLLQWLVYPALWLLLQRWLSTSARPAQPWLLAPVALAVALVCVTASVRAAMAWYHLRAAEAAQRSGDHATALREYAGVLRAADLGLTGLQDRARLGTALSLAGLGRVDEARASLGIRVDTVRVLDPADWEGPTGAELFRNGECWKNLWLWEGAVELQLSVTAQPARGEWPRLRVRLGDQDLGEVQLSSTPQVQTLATTVPTGRYRLQIALANGLWTSAGEHRWARLDRLEVRYLEQGG